MMSRRDKYERGEKYIKEEKIDRRRIKEEEDEKPIKRIKQEKDVKGDKPKDIEKPNYSLSGKLAEDTNTFKGVVIKYNEPPEAKIPIQKWRLFPFKGDDPLPCLYLQKQSAFLLGRDRLVADIPIDHPSCSKQHAVLQFRCISLEKKDGSTGRKTKPYIIDLGSSNGTYLNGDKIEAQRYYELIHKDILKFGYSTREYVVMNEDVKEVDQIDDDQ